jgi:oligopeptide transport system substrate-binding protein
MKKILNVNLQEGNPTTLHPHLGVDLRSRCLFLALYEPLMRRNSEGTLEFAAAESVDVNSTQTIYTFHIRDQKWSNGKPVTAQHFANAWKYALKPNSPCIRADLYYSIKNARKVKTGVLPFEELKISTPDEKTLVVELEHPTPYFLDLTATSFYAPLYEASEKEPTVFNGPFMLANWAHDRNLSFSKNPSYWDKNTVQLDEINFSMVKDPMTALVMFEKGEIDVVGDPFSSLPFDAIPSLAKSGKLQSRMISRIFYILINTNHPVLKSKALRKALSLSIDRKQLTQHLCYGEVPTYTHIPINLSTLNPKDVPNQADEAGQLFDQALKELDLTRENFPKITINFANLSGQKSLMEFVQEEWRKNLGIKTELICSDWNMHLAALRKKDYQIGTIHLATLYQDPTFYFELFRDKNVASNYSGWEQASYRELLESAETTIDANKRNLILQQAEKQLLDEMPVIPVFTQTLQYLVRQGVKIVILDTGVYDFKWTRITPQEDLAIQKES